MSSDTNKSISTVKRDQLEVLSIAEGFFQSGITRRSADKELAHFLDTSGCGTLLDLGCGPGTYAFHLGTRNPNRQMYLLDFPGVLEVMWDVWPLYSIENQIHYLPLDALKDEIPGSYDIILV